MSLGAIADLFMAWIDVIARALLAIVGRFHSPRRVRLVEADGDLFHVEIADQSGATRSTAAPIGIAQARIAQIRIADGRIENTLPAALAATLRGSRLELVLKPDRFLFRPLELPRRATEFLDGIVCAQIDRLTPWSAGDAAFGWTQPSELGKDRVVVTVAATTRALMLSYLEALMPFGARSLTVTTTSDAAVPGTGRISVFEHSVRGETGLRRTRGLLATGFVLMIIAAGIAAVGSQLAIDSLDAQEQELSQRIAQHRAAMLRTATGESPQRLALERRKRETPANVLAIEALSQVLPDHTYVTELHIEGDKLQVIGMTRDAPALIELIERSPHFTRATFFAPTTRSPGNAGEQFHIEAHIKPVFEPHT